MQSEETWPTLPGTEPCPCASIDNAASHACGKEGFRPFAKSAILGAASAKFLLGTPSGWWESSAHRGATTLIFDAAWAIGLTGFPSLIGWRPAQAWKGAATLSVVAFGSAGVALALASHASVADKADLALRLVRLAVESVTAVGVLAITGAWLVVKPRR